jgi:hypothetical protein
MEAFMTNEPSTPEWVRKHNEQRAEEERLEAAVAAQRRVAVASVQADGPDFWTRLVNRTIVNVRALPDFKGEELAGSVSPSTGGPEHSCLIQVNRESVRYGAELSKMSLWYAPGGNQIRCWYQDQPLPNFVLGASGDGVVASVDGDIYTAEQLADHIVEWMAARVKVRQSV